MSAIHPVRTGGVPARSNTVRTLMQSWLENAVRGWRRRKTVAALAALDDRMLMDIGIERGTIARFVDTLEDRELRMAPFAAAVPPTPVMDEPYRRAA
ncbi:DUF1127 domain-containing protein [Cereibacter changlensis]|uniref:DUF1127 domain-containing protein n=1 Tax=Cereibacter changlensis TaxID=402884 RepID=UPI000DAC5021|nr:DUF1127 domain-containing protein [Cereibacter changlensis]